jgi:Tfp pilus assembly protein PilO
MRKSFSIGSLLGAGTGQLYLRVALVLLLLLNLAGLFLYLDPPGGSQQDLAAQDRQIRNQIAAVSVRGARLKLMADRLESGSSQISDFQKRYFLPKRVAYGEVIEELQRMAQISGLQERDAGLSEEPIEGTDDLSLLNIKANYEGSYSSLIHFLYEADRSPMLLMLDSLTAAPEQKNGQISTDIRFQAVIQDSVLNPVSGPLTGPAQEGSPR